MEKTVLVDYAGEAEKPQTYIEPDNSARLERKNSGTVAPPLDVYEPGFRTELYEAIRDYWKGKREMRDKLQALRERTGIGRYRTWTP